MTDLVQNYNIEICNDVNKCALTLRHYRSNKTDNDDKKNRHPICVEIFDNIHLYLFHLETLGLRLSRSEREQIQTQPEEKGPVDSDFVDHLFGTMQKILQSKEKSRDFAVDRWLSRQQLSKFTLGGFNYAESKHEGTYTHTDKREKTFIDNMLIFIGNESNEKLVNDLQTFVGDEEFDTDCITYEFGTDIIFHHICDDDEKQKLIFGECDKNIKSFIKYQNMSSKSFSTGIVFWYWKYYENIDEDKYRQEQLDVNQYDFGGYSMKKLFVKRFYKSFKEEILNSGFLNKREYDEHVVRRAVLFFRTKRSKSLSCQFALGENDPLHFGIYRGAKIKASHLEAVILYCDFTQFSTKFSKAFRATKLNESIKSIKNRNSKFYHTAKNLRELVQYYGLSGYDVRDGATESGPFYTGMAARVRMAAFAIRLNGPSSTSKQLEVAIKSATTD
eukprot:373276_1